MADCLPPTPRNKLCGNSMRELRQMSVWQSKAHRAAGSRIKWPLQIALSAVILLYSPPPARGQSVSALAAAASIAEPMTNAQPGYRINAGDDLDVSVWGEEKMTRITRVLPDGTINVPLAGTITAAAKTVEQVSEEIRQRIAPNYRTSPPEVTVTVRDATGMRFYVVGKVRTPGSFSTGRAVDSLQALSMAGGLAEFADVKNAVILRHTADGQVVEPVRLASVLKGHRRLKPGELAEPLPLLRSGDVLVIP